MSKSEIKKYSKQVLRKIFFHSLMIFAITSLALKSFAQEITTSQSLKEASQAPTPTVVTEDKKISETKPKEENATIDSINNKINLVGKKLENSSLADNIQSGMASLLLGNKTTSLMFDDQENENIERAIDSLKNNQAYSPDGSEVLAGQDGAEKSEDFNAKSYIYLASIMYSTPQNWVVWINDKKITSDDNAKNKEIFVRSIEKDRVSILWNISPSKLRVLLGRKADDLKLKVNSAGQTEVKFLLQPNQTFILGSNLVVEGKVLTNMLKKDPSTTDKATAKMTDLSASKVTLIK